MLGERTFRLSERQVHACRHCPDKNITRRDMEDLRPLDGRTVLIEMMIHHHVITCYTCGKPNMPDMGEPMFGFWYGQKPALLYVALESELT